MTENTERPERRHPAASRLTDRAEVRHSPIAGLGLFAAAPIEAGGEILIIGGRPIDDAELAAQTPPYSSLSVDDGVHLLLDPAHPARYGNHSCDPSMWHDDATTLVARRAIAAGEELTVDYATHTGVESWSMDCSCGTPLCRGKVTGADWRLPVLHRAYGRHWTPPLLDRVRSVADPGLPLG